MFTIVTIICTIKIVHISSILIFKSILWKKIKPIRRG